MTTSTTCQSGIPITGRHCGEHCHGWCLLDGEPCTLSCNDRNPLDEPMDAPTRSDYVFAIGLAVVCVLALWIATRYAY